MKVKEFDDFHKTRRPPWLIGTVVVLLVVFVVWRWQRARGEGDSGEQGQPQEGVTVAGAGAEEASPAVGGVTGPGTNRVGAARKEGVPVGADPAEIDAHLAEARAMAARDQLQDARRVYLGILAGGVSASIARLVEDELGPIHIALATTPRMMTEKVEYAVRSGDSLARLAKRFGTTMELIQKGNRVSNPNRISVGDRFRIMNRPAFSIVVRKRANELTLNLNGRFFKRYTVGTGKFGRTPVGTFVIKDRIPEPPWWRPDGREVPFGDPANILGTRWLSIDASGETPEARGYGIHGTWDDSSLGKQSSAGCVRMNNGDVEELFMLVASGTPVEILE